MFQTVLSSYRPGAAADKLIKSCETVYGRKTKRDFDYNNIIQGLQDMMVKAGYLPDDNANYITPHFEDYEVDKRSPRTILSVY